MKTSFRTKNLIYSLLLLPSIFIVPLYQSKSIENSPSTFTMSIDEKFVDYTVEEIATGGAHSGIIINDGTSDHLYTWGYNKYGQLGLGDNYQENKYNTPHEVIFYEEEGLLTNPIENTDLEHLSLGGNYSAVVLNDDDGDHLYTWGDNYWGQLGLGVSPADSSASLTKNGDKYLSYNTPKEVKFSDDEKGNIEEVSLGLEHSAIIMTSPNGTEEYIYSWGSNYGGKLGYDDKIKDSEDGQHSREVKNTEGNGTEEIFYYNKPNQIQGNPFWEKNLIDISMGNDHSAAISIDDDNNNVLYTWGRNYRGQLGNHGDPELSGADHNFFAPTEVVFYENGYSTNPTIDEANIEQISMGGAHSSAVVNDSLYTWGFNSRNQLGLGTSTKNNEFVPQEVTNLPNGEIEQISMGENHSSAIVNNELYTWGDNTSGELGMGSDVSGTTPQKVEGLPKGEITQISMGSNYSVALIENEEDKYLYTWGLNNRGQLGLGNFDNKDYPQEAASLIVTPFTQKWYFYLLITIIIIAVLTVIVITTLLIIKAIQKPKIVN